MYKTTCLAILISVIMMVTASLYGAYISFQPVEAVQPDGAKLSLFASGDEYYNWLHDKVGYTVKKNDKGWYVFAEWNGKDLLLTDLVAGRDNPAQRNIMPWTNIPSEEMGRIRLARQSQIPDTGGSRVPHSGTLNNLVIFIRFADQTEFGQNLSYYSGMFNGAGNTMQAYFSEASYNALNINTAFYPATTTTVVSWQDSHIRGYFSPYNATTNPTGYQNSLTSTYREQTLLSNAVLGVRSAIPTSLNLDGDNDGNVDNVCFVIKGATDGWSELLWPHRWSLYSLNTTINGNRVYDYNFQLSEFLVSRGTGVLCHEMYHSLGAPDLYHYESNGITPVGAWDVMQADANPPQHMSAYMKFRYGGWISSIPVATTPGVYTLNPLTSSTNNCYRINSPGSTSQYFVVEFRKKTGQFESSVPGSGLVIYRINTDFSGNASGPPDEVYAFRPNGTTTVDGDVGNAFFSSEAGRTMFNLYTNPYPYLYNATSEPAGGISLKAISSSAGNTMSFTLGSGDPAAALTEGFESGIPSAWAISGNAGWASETVNFFSGAKSLKSGTITHNQTSTISSVSLPLQAGYISFFYKISSEANYDVLRFYIDGVERGKWSGERNWTMVAFDVTAGDHVLKWTYSKDSSTSTGSDCAWVDHLAYTVAVFNPPVTLTSATGHARAVLNWQAPATGTPAYYLIYRDNVMITTTTGLTYTNTGLTNGTSYSFHVAAHYVNPTGNSAATNTVTLTPVALPATNLSGTMGNATVTINWQAPATGVPGGYKIYRNSVYLATVTALTYTDNTVVNETTYSYQVKAAYTSPTTESAASNIVTLTPTANTIVTIGAGTSINQHLPVEPFYRYTYSQSIYLQNEINLANKRIYKLAWQYNGNSAWSNDAIKIWMGHTSNTAYASTAEWLPIAGLAQVYNDTLSVTTTLGWVEITLNTPFLYNNTGNLVIAVDENSYSYHATGDEFYGSTVAGNRGIYYYSDSINPDPANPLAASAIISSIPNLRLYFEDIPATPVFSATPDAIVFPEVDLGDYTTPQEQITISNVGNIALQINAISLSDAAQFQILQLPGAFPVSLQPGAGINLVARYNPSAVGVHTANLIITDNLGRTTHAVALTGNCVDNAVIPPHQQDFAAYLPSYWTKYSGLLATPTTLTSGGNWVADGYGNNGTTGAARLNVYGTAVKSWLVTPSINLGAGDATMRLEFDIALTAYNSTAAANTTGTDDRFGVVISTDNGITWSTANLLKIWNNSGAADVYNNIPGTGTHVTIPLSSYSGRVRIGFYGESTVTNADNDITLDNVNITLTLVPVIHLAQTSLAFGEAVVGTMSQKTFTVENTGNTNLMGSINVPAGYATDLEFLIPARQTRSYNLSFQPTEVSVYNGNMIITSNDPDQPQVQIALSGSGYIPPTLIMNTQSLHTTVMYDSTADQTFTLENTGSKDLIYNIQAQDSTGNGIQVSRSTSFTPERSIAGTVLALNTTEYLPGTTLNWAFSVTNASTDTEWLKNIKIQFPAGITVHSSTAFVGGSGGDLVSNASTGDGAVVIWHGEAANGWGVVHGGQTAVATVNVTIDSTYSGNLELPYQIDGDVYGAEPHTVADTLTLPQGTSVVSWLFYNTLSGTISAGQTHLVRISYLTANTSPGAHQADLQITTNDPLHPIVTLPVTLSITLATPAPHIAQDLSGLKIVWDDIPGASHYLVYRSISAQGGFQLLDTVTTSYINISELNTVYFYQVVAVFR